MLPTPILSNINTFDPSESTLISFYYTGGQIQRKRLVIRDSDNKIIYNKEQVGMRLLYELPAKSLGVGTYTAQILVFDFEENSSDYSAPVIFYCKSKPEVSLPTPPSEIHSAQYSTMLNYKQAQDENIKQYCYFLYDSQHRLVSKSGYFTTIKSYTFQGLKNLSTYYIRCTGETIHGMSFDTGEITLLINYIVQPNNMILRTVNNKCEGYITVDCNIIDIGYKVENDNYKFNKDGVTLENNKVTYNSGFEFSDNFSIFIKAKEVPLDQVFFSYTFTGGKAELQILRFAGKYYCELKVTGTANYVQYVELPNVAILSEDGKTLITDEHGNILQQVTLDYVNQYMVVFDVKRKNGLYELKAYYENNGYFEI